MGILAFHGDFIEKAMTGLNGCRGAISDMTIILWISMAFQQMLAVFVVDMEPFGGCWLMKFPELGKQ
jgi:hypothetical protein